MSFRSRLLHHIIIERAQQAVGSDPAAEDEYGQPLTTDYNQPVVVYTKVDEVHGLVQPLTLREMAMLGDAGTVVGSYRVVVPRSVDLTTHDRVRFAGPADECPFGSYHYATDPRYFQIQTTPDAAGVGHHYEAIARTVEGTPLEQAG